MEYRWTPEPYLASKYPLINPQLDERGRRELEAERAISEGRAGEAKAIFAELAKAEPESGYLWTRLGFAALSVGDHTGAITAYERGARVHALTPTDRYNLACAYARVGDREKALQELRTAVAALPRLKGAAQGDSDLESLRGDARFQRLVSSPK